MIRDIKFGFSAAEIQEKKQKREKLTKSNINFGDIPEIEEK